VVTRIESIRPKRLKKAFRAFFIVLEITPNNKNYSADAQLF